MNSLTPGSISATLSTQNRITAEKKDDMDRQAFLTLFTTQLQNQNPLDPVKNEAFVAQLAQFSQLEATTKMASSLETLVSALQGDRLLAGANLIGKRVNTPEGTAELYSEGAISSILSVPQGADSVQLDVYNSTGKKVFTQSLGRQMPGDVTVRWNGFDQNGDRMPAGRYQIIATVDSFGQISRVPITTPSTVTSVTYSPTAKELILELEDGSSVPLSEVQRIDSRVTAQPGA